MTRKERYEYVLNYFREHTGNVSTELQFGSVFQLLVAVVLSAQCTDKRVNQITPELFRRFPDAKTLAAADEAEVYECVKSVSYPNAKAAHIVAMARELIERFGGEVPACFDSLVSLPGVGRKTANVIMAVAFGEALQPEFKEYSHQVIKNAKALEESLKEEGFRLVTGGTDNHLLLIDVKSSCGITGKKAQRLLDEINITANKNAIPFDTEKPFKASGIRVGTPAMTTKGFKEDDFREVGKIIAYRLKNEETDEVKNECLARVKKLTDKVTMYDDIKY